MFTPCEMNTRPSASVMKPPAFENGGAGAASAEPARMSDSNAPAMPARIGGRLPHLAARDLHFGGPVAGFRARPRAACGAAGLPLGLHNTRGRARLAHGAGRVRERDRVREDRHWRD